MDNNGKKLLDIITDLDPELIANADKKPHGKGRLFMGITTGMAIMAAAAVIAVALNRAPSTKPPIADSNGSVSSSETESSDIANSGGTNSSRDDSDTSAKDPPVLDFSEYKHLPKITLTERYSVGGMGGGNIESLHSWETLLSSPWNGTELKTMPVYMSCSTEIPDIDKMYARVREIAAALGISEDKLVITDTYSYDDIARSIETQRKIAEEAGASPKDIEELIDRIKRHMVSGIYVEAEADGIRIHLNTAYAAQIFFYEPVWLPGSYNFANNASAEERNAALGYLAESYKKLTGYNKPLPGQHTTFGSYVYEADGEFTEQIVNYWINTTEFQADENTGNIDYMWIYTDDALKKLGDYPILTAAQAEAILKSNRYDKGDRMPANAKIMKTDIVYENLPGSTAVMPYYKFYVEIDNELESGYDLVCEVYSISAVPEEFIEPESGIKKE